MSAEEHQSCSANYAQPLVGAIWVIGWWFTIGLAKLIWWKALIAIVLWPWFLGVALR